MICDVDNGSVNFDVDRIRKSDLIIVDYHLDNNAPDKTLKLLQDLKDSDHLNMIVIYTREFRNGLDADIIDSQRCSGYQQLDH